MERVSNIQLRAQQLHHGTLPDFQAAASPPSCPQDIFELSGKVSLASVERSLRAEVTVPNVIRWSNFLVTLLDFGPD